MPDGLRLPALESRNSPVTYFALRAARETVERPHVQAVWMTTGGRFFLARAGRSAGGAKCSLVRSIWDCMRGESREEISNNAREDSCPTWMAQSRKSSLRNADHFPPLSRFVCPCCAKITPPPPNRPPLRKMFKRVEKKLARKREEEELGITEEVKEAIGLNDLDSSSDESEASSSSSGPKISSKRKRLLDDDESDVGSDVGSEGQGSGTSGDAEEDDEDEPGVQMTIEEALHNPLYIVSIQPDIRGCILCPRKLLKNDVMVSVHMKSQVRCASIYANIPRVVMEIS